MNVLYYQNGVLQSPPTVTSENPLTFTGITVPAGGNVILVYEATTNNFAPLDEGSVITNVVTVNATGLNTPITAEETITVQRLIENTKMNLLVYTGYTREEIFDKYGDIASKIDILITGEYKRELDDGKGLRGSSNQEIIVKDEKLNSQCQELLKSRQQKIDFIDGRFIIMGLEK